ncbi:hypothetical protein KSB_81980 [Ktedonobacter robiniae]|uniref:Uncharacterized protein n=1 Tax=Ktedonobacter robiniae TaxID=2778365 RepID=A0ABQ3V402_9CHLR|nr:hypothetical protein KSB_81980 [Ktedonobacter robiniae]
MDATINAEVLDINDCLAIHINIYITCPFKKKEYTKDMTKPKNYYHSSFSKGHMKFLSYTYNVFLIEKDYTGQ